MAVFLALLELAVTCAVGVGVLFVAAVVVEVCRGWFTVPPRVRVYESRVERVGMGGAVRVERGRR